MKDDNDVIKEELEGLKHTMHEAGLTEGSLISFIEQAVKDKQELIKLRGAKFTEAQYIALQDAYDKNRAQLETMDRSFKILDEARDLIVKQFREHQVAVGKFLKDMYSTMIDPLAEGEMSVEEMCKALLDQAEKDRQLIHDLMETKK